MDREFAARLIRKFQQRAPEDFEQLQQKCAAGAVEEATRRRTASKALPAMWPQTAWRVGGAPGEPGTGR